MTEMYSIFSATVNPDDCLTPVDRKNGITAYRYHNKFYDSAENNYPLAEGCNTYEEATNSINLHTTANTGLMNNLFGNDNDIYVCGQAKSHCVADSIIDLLNHKQNEHKIGNVYLVGDCSSPIPGAMEGATKHINEALQALPGDQDIDSITIQSNEIPSGTQSEQSKKNILLIIDPQNDFHSADDKQNNPTPTLSVPGSVTDAVRIVELIDSNKFVEIHVTLDTHTPYHIGHSGFYSSGYGPLRMYDGNQKVPIGETTFKFKVKGSPLPEYISAKSVETSHRYENVKGNLVDLQKTPKELDQPLILNKSTTLPIFNRVRDFYNNSVRDSKTDDEIKEILNLRHYRGKDELLMTDLDRKYRRGIKNKGGKGGKYSRRSSNRCSSRRRNSNHRSSIRRNRSNSRRSRRSNIRRRTKTLHLTRRRH